MEVDRSSLSLDKSLDDLIKEKKSAKPFKSFKSNHRPVSAPYAIRNNEGANRCYVGNLSYSTKWPSLKDHMREAGEVVFAEVYVDTTGKSKGCGIVEYATARDAANAIQTLNATTLDNRPIFVREDREPRQPTNRTRNDTSIRRLGSRFGNASESGKKIFIRNLPFSTSWQDLKDTFSESGKIIHADVLTNKEGVSLGSGVILFESREAVSHAIKNFDGITIYGRQIHVRQYNE